MSLNNRTNYNKIAYKISKKSREKKFREFIEYFNPSEKNTVLNVGVSNSEPSDLIDNYFSKMYPYSHKMTALSVGDLSDYEKAYPAVKTISYKWEPKRRFPFNEKEFDIAISNAVIEHVGNYEAQKDFLSEIVRVSKKGMLTTPNKWFPIETHYKLPFIHWRNNDKFQDFLKNKFQSEENLYLLGKKDLINLCEELKVPNYEIRENHIFLIPMPMTFSLFWRNN